ncbi:MAG TPA: hypothetical protein VJ731_12325 [Terriglobales bacterium]|nr:hypothetical protein [Terriglobales bacterium]
MRLDGIEVRKVALAVPLSSSSSDLACLSQGMSTAENIGGLARNEAKTIDPEPPDKLVGEDETALCVPHIPHANASLSMEKTGIPAGRQ